MSVIAIVKCIVTLDTIFSFEHYPADPAQPDMTGRQMRHLHLPADQDKAYYRDSLMTISGKEVDTFFTLLCSDMIKQFLTNDECNNHADNYLLAMVFVYFKRINLSLAEYSVHNFWLCLYLAHDQEEDEEELKWELLPWALGPILSLSYLQFLKEKDQLTSMSNFI